MDLGVSKEDTKIEESTDTKSATTTFKNENGAIVQSIIKSKIKDIQISQENDKVIAKTTLDKDESKLDVETVINPNGTVKATLDIDKNTKTAVKTQIESLVAGTDSNMLDNGDIVLSSNVEKDNNTKIVNKVTAFNDGSVQAELHLKDNDKESASVEIHSQQKGSNVTLQKDGSLKLLSDTSPSKIDVLAKTDGTITSSFKSKASNVVTNVDTLIPSTNVTISKDGVMLISTPSIETSTGKRVAIDTQIETNGNISTKITVEENGVEKNITLPKFDVGSQVVIKKTNENKVSIEITTPSLSKNQVIQF